MPEETDHPTNPDDAAQGGDGDAAGTPGLLVTIDAVELARLREDAGKFGETLDQLLRLTADYQNLRKRMERDTEDRAKRKTENLLRSVLNGLDELDRACANARQESPLMQGVLMIRESLLQAAASEGVREISCVGLAFDPKLHDAVSSVESPQAPGTVVAEHRKGYLWGERVLRPSQVVVSANSSAGNSAGTKETPASPPASENQ
ncbi:MAG: nucleotide exchange factor GrpE [Planctomycetes bacterium]|nr:nucleotide exchange factor GrpE [Planctomycetota bacterium]